MFPKLSMGKGLPNRRQRELVLTRALEEQWQINAELEQRLRWQQVESDALVADRDRLARENRNLTFEIHRLKGTDALLAVHEAVSRRD